MSAFLISDDGRTARIDKGVGESLSYEFDFTALLAGANIHGAPVLTIDERLAMVGVANDAKTVSVQLSGGVLGAHHPVTCSVTTDETPAEIYTRTMIIRGVT